VRKRANDLELLPIGTAEFCYTPARIERKSGSLCDVREYSSDLVERIPAGSTECDIFRDRHRRNERELLMDHSYSGRYRVGGRCKSSSLPFDSDETRIRLKQAERDSHERCLPRAILSEQSGYSAAVHCE
jgi:hypothetical protein